ncbi:hypothetical protein Pelo_15714 [Pelomyxa schiedti]|nr:hypothetical protein Pelo_15714 [Pelomyxa schiedti]
MSGSVRAFHIKLPQNLYFVGSPITGQLVMHLHKPILSKGVHVYFRGVVVTNLTANHPSEVNKYLGSRREPICDVAWNCWVPPHGKKEANVEADNEVVYDFKFDTTGHDFPASFDGALGFVRYTIVAVIRRNWKSDYKTVHPFTLCPVADVSVSRPLTGKLENKIGWINPTKVTLDWKSPRSAFCPGEAVPLTVTVENRTKKLVSKVIVTLQQEVKYTGAHGKTLIRWGNLTSETILTSVHEDQTSDFDVNIKIPPCPPNIPSHTGKLITVGYCLHIKAIMKGSSDFFTRHEIVIGTTTNKAPKVVATPPPIGSSTAVYVVASSPTPSAPMVLPSQSQMSSSQVIMYPPRAQPNPQQLPPNGYPNAQPQYPYPPYPQYPPYGTMPPGAYPPPGQMTLPPGQMPPPGQMFPPGQVPPGQMPPPGQMFPPGQMPPGQLPPPGQMPPSQMFPPGPGQMPPNMQPPSGQPLTPQQQQQMMAMMMQQAQFRTSQAQLNSSGPLPMPQYPPLPSQPSQPQLQPQQSQPLLYPQMSSPQSQPSPLQPQLSQPQLYPNPSLSQPQPSQPQQPLPQPSQASLLGPNPFSGQTYTFYNQPTPTTTPTTPTSTTSTTPSAPISAMSPTPTTSTPTPSPSTPDTAASTASSGTTGTTTPAPTHSPRDTTNNITGAIIVNNGSSPSPGKPKEKDDPEMEIVYQPVYACFNSLEALPSAPVQYQDDTPEGPLLEDSPPVDHKD